MKIKKCNLRIIAMSFLAIIIFCASNAQPDPNRKDIQEAFNDFSKSKHKLYIAKVFDCDENKKLHDFTMLLTPNGFIQFGSNPKVIGREAIESMLIRFNKTFKHLAQHIIKVFKDTDNEIVYSAEATYSFDDGTTLEPIPYMIHLKFDGEVVSEYRIYIDLSPYYKKVSKN
ncbi:MAG: hypothetical protein K2X26_01675 [Chitinophagaceae bacterium]|nr:hypothetical protein [Chitinophagaceae bacterium]